MRRLFSVLDGRLAESEYLADDYSIADIANWAWVRGYVWSGVSIDTYPNLQRWLEQFALHPACRVGVEIPTPIHRIDDPQGAEQFIAEARKMLAPGRQQGDA